MDVEDNNLGDNVVENGIVENGIDGSDDDSDDSSKGYEQMEELDMNVLCLFCPQTSTTVKNCIRHCLECHGFDIYKLRDQFALDNYGYIKLINYIRMCKPDPKELNETNSVLWSSEDFMKPYDVNDAWLWHDLEGLKGISLDDDKPSNYVNSENGNVTMAQEHFSDLLNTIQSLTDEVREKETQLTRLKEVISCIDEKIITSSSHLKASEDMSYFSSYNGASIHWEMLSDTIRTFGYKKAIDQNATFFHNKTVLDVGCGTGILSLMSATAGAKKVVAVDQSDILYQALEIAKENNLLDKISFVKGKVEQAVLPIRKYDIIISEWMGYFLLFEGMLDSIIYARKNLLAPNGILLPTTCSIYLVGASDPTRHESISSFWNDVYGYKMPSMVNLTLKEACVELVRSDDVVTTPFKIHSIDVNTCDEQNIYFNSEFTLVSIKDTLVTQLVGFFDVHFQLPISNSFTTGPYGPPTHWKQTVFFLREPINLKKDKILRGTIACYRLPKEVRSLQIDITIENRKQSYFLT